MITSSHRQEIFVFGPCDFALTFCHVLTVLALVQDFLVVQKVVNVSIKIEDLGYCTITYMNNNYLVSHWFESKYSPINVSEPEIAQIPHHNTNWPLGGNRQEKAVFN